MAYPDRSDPLAQSARSVRQSLHCFKARRCSAPSLHRLCDGNYSPVPYMAGIGSRQPCECDCEHVGAAPFAELPTIETRIERLGELGRIIRNAGDARQSISCWIADTAGLTDYHQLCVGDYLPLREPMQACECACGHAREGGDAEAENVFWLSDARPRSPVDAGQSIAGGTFPLEAGQQEGA